MKKNFVAVPGLLLFGLLAGCRSKPPSESQNVAVPEPVPVAVEIETATFRPVETKVSAEGLLTTAPNGLSRVAATTSARLIQVLVREGDHVRAGQLIARTDGRANDAASASAAAALSASAADARSAELAVQAARSDEVNAVRQADLALRSTAAEGRGAIISARNALQSAESDLKRAKLAALSPDVRNALSTAKAAYQSALIDRESAVSAAQTAMKSAQSDLDKIRAGAREPEIASARAGVNQAKATRDRAQTEVDRIQFLVDKGIKAKRELDDAQTALSVAQAGLDTAQQSLNLLLAGARPEEIQSATLAVQAARQTLEAARVSGDTKVEAAKNDLDAANTNVQLAHKSRPEDVKSAALKVDAARAALDQAVATSDAKLKSANAGLGAARASAIQVSARTADAQAKAAAMRGKAADLVAAQVNSAAAEIRAPLDGIVTKRLLNQGDMTDPASPILEISNASALVMEARIPAETGGAIRPGMQAILRAESAPGRSFPGVVQSVGQVDPLSGLLTVRVLVPNSKNRLKIGALASCEIIVSRRPRAVTVPLSAVVTREGHSVVLVAEGQVAHQRDVTVGAPLGKFVEIRQGISAGERVIRLGQYELEDGAKINIKSR